MDAKNPVHLDGEKQMNYKLVPILTLVGLVFLFIMQNVSIVDIQFLFWSIQIPRSLLVIIMLAIAVVIGWFLHSFMRHRIKYFCEIH